MNRSIKGILSMLALVCALPLQSATDSEVEARKLALDLAGAFANEGFRVRDGYWTGELKPQENAVIAVNLYAGNQYWFTAAANGQVKKMAVDVFDESGNPVASEPYESGDKAAAGFSPETSGQYFVSVRMLEGEPSMFCLLYSYK